VKERGCGDTLDWERKAVVLPGFLEGDLGMGYVERAPNKSEES
jgi:hypothetical protein